MAYNRVPTDGAGRWLNGGGGLGGSYANMLSLRPKGKWVPSDAESKQQKGATLSDTIHWRRNSRDCNPYPPCQGPGPGAPPVGYCRLQMPLKPALGVRGTVAVRRLGAARAGGGGGVPMHPCSSVANAPGAGCRATAINAPKRGKHTGCCTTTARASVTVPLPEGLPRLNYRPTPSPPPHALTRIPFHPRRPFDCWRA